MKEEETLNDDQVVIGLFVFVFYIIGLVQAFSKSCLLGVIAIFTVKLTILIALLDLLSETDVWGAIAKFLGF